MADCVSLSWRRQGDAVTAEKGSETLRLAEVSPNLSAVRKRHLTSNKQRLKCRVVAQSSPSLERTAPLGRAEPTVS